MRLGEILARGDADIGIQQAVELTSFPGVDVVGPLPPEMQTVTDYVIAIPKMRGTRMPGSLMEFLRSPEGARLLVEEGSMRGDTRLLLRGKPAAGN